MSDAFRRRVMAALTWAVWRSLMIFWAAPARRFSPLKERQPWMQTFPGDFYAKMFRLRG